MICYLLDNHEITQSDFLPKYDTSLFNNPGTTCANSNPPNLHSTANRNVQPDILTHGNISNTIGGCQEENYEPHVPITDKITVSSLYVDMVHNSTDVEKNNPQITAIPASISLPCIPIDVEKSTCSSTDLIEGKQIRLGMKPLGQSLRYY